MKVIADLCVVPMGVGVSVSAHVAACERVLREAGLVFPKFASTQVQIMTNITLPNPDLATTLQQAVASLAKIIETKPDADRLLAEMVRLSGQALQAVGAGVWVTETPDRPELILE